MLREEFEKQVSFNVDDKIYEIANNLYMQDFDNNRDFCVALDTLVFYIEQKKDTHLLSTVDDYLFDLCYNDKVEEISNFLYSLLGVNTVIYLKAKNHIPLNAYDITIIEDELKVLVYEIQKKCESKAV